MKTKTYKCGLMLAMLVALMTAGTINSKAGVQISGNVFTNGPFIIGVTNSNAGVLVNGGAVFNCGNLIVGNGTTTNNSVTVTGSGSLWNCAFLYSGDSGANGNYGSGNHYNFNSGGGMIVGDPNLYGGGSGQGTVSIGSNNTFLVTDSGSYFSCLTLSAGNGNTFSILNGAAFLNGSLNAVYLGSSNSFVISGVGTTANLARGIQGDSFNGLSVSNGASFICDSIDFFGISNTLVFDGAQTRCTATNGIQLGSSQYTNWPSGKLTIKNGAQVTTGGAYLSGNNPGAQTIVSDSGTILTIMPSVYGWGLNVGAGFPDTNVVFIVTNGASVVLHNDCTMQGQLGVLQVVGINSLLSAPTNRIYVGIGGGGGNNLQIGVGGQVVAGGVQVGSAGNAISNSMNVAGRLYVTNSTGTAVFELHDARATCNGGLIVADQLICGLGGGLPGILTASSGTVQFKSAMVANGLPLIIGDKTNTANYVMQGGTHSFASGLLISSNSVLSGCGTVAGSVTNYGTILLGGCDITFSNAVVNFGTIIATNGLPHFRSTFSNQGSFVINPPAFQILTQTNGAFKFNWSTVEGVNYQVQYKTNLTQTNWINLGSAILATNSIMTISDFLTNSQRFYRIRSN